MCESWVNGQPSLVIRKNMKSPITDLEIYREAMEIGENVWSAVHGWDIFAKDTIGRQCDLVASYYKENLIHPKIRFFIEEIVSELGDPS